MEKLEEAPTPISVTPDKIDEIISKEIDINQDNKIIKLDIKIENNYIYLKILNKEPLIKGYSSKYTLEEIQSFHKIFSIINTFKEFIDIISTLASNNKISIQKNEENLYINLEAEYLYKKIDVKIKLFPQLFNAELNIINVYEQLNELKNILNSYENENKALQEEKNKILNEIKILREYCDKTFVNKSENDTNKIKGSIKKMKENVDKDIKDIKNDNNNYKIKFEKDIQTLKGDINNSKKENNDNIKALQGKLDENNKNFNNKLNEINNNMKNQNQNIKNEIQKEYTEKYKKIMEQNTSFNNEITNLKKLTTSLNNELNNIKKINTSLNNEISELKKQNTSMNNEINNLKLQNKGFKENNDKLNEECNKFKSEIQNLNKKVNEFEIYKNYLNNIKKKEEEEKAKIAKLLLIRLVLF